MNIVFRVLFILSILQMTGTAWAAESSNPLQRYQSILWQHLKVLSDFGPRNPGSEGFSRSVQYIEDVGRSFADDYHSTRYSYALGMGRQFIFTNIEFVFEGKESGPAVLIGAHYDTRPYADEEEDSSLHESPIVGANDGGSGTAVLLTLAQYFREHRPQRTVKLVFFDGEDFGRKNSGQTLLGSSFYAHQLEKKDRSEWPGYVLIVDMVADRELQIFKENHSIKSAPRLVDAIFDIAKELEHTQFKQKSKYSIFDDHTPFIRLGIPSAVLIDFDYPYWHTLEDTLDKCSPESLFAAFEVVVETIKRVHPNEAGPVSKEKDS